MKILDTTVNLREEVYVYLNKLCLECKMSKKSIILFALRKFRKHSPFNEVMNVNVMYQSDAEKWRKVHIVFNNTEREISYDLRKLYKFSLSFIVSFSILKYGKELLEGDQESIQTSVMKFMDNYTEDSYSYASKTVKNDKILVFRWIKGHNKQKE